MNKDSITITKEQFNDAVHEVMKDIMDDPKIEGMGKLLIPLTGATFAHQVCDKLFGKADETEESKED